MNSILPFNTVNCKNTELNYLLFLHTVPVTMSESTGRQSKTYGVSMTPEMKRRVDERISKLDTDVASFSNYVQRLIALDLRANLLGGQIAWKLYMGLEPSHTALTRIMMDTNLNLPKHVSEGISVAEERLNAVRQVLSELSAFPSNPVSSANSNGKTPRAKAALERILKAQKIPTGEQ